MAFPETNWLGMKKGWQDLGRVAGVCRHGDEDMYYKSHAFCGDVLNIGKNDNGEYFYFCMRCMIKIEPKSK